MNDYMGLIFDKSMKDKEDFKVQKLNDKELSVILNYNYKITSDNDLFETIEYIVEEINRKNQL